MPGQRPVYQWCPFDVRCRGIELAGQSGFGMDEVYFGQKFIGLQYFLIMRPDLSREFL